MRRVSMKRVVGAIGVLAVLGLAGCGSGGGDGTSAASDDAAKQGSSEPIVIGMPIALSGAMNAYDAPEHAGAQLAVAEINAKGGVLGRQLEIVTADNKSDVSLVGRTALEVLNKGAKLVIPTHDYDFAGPAAREANGKGVVVIGGAGDARFGAKGLGEYVYNVYKAGGTEGAAAATFAHDEQQWKNAFVLEDTSINYSKSFTDYFMYSWEALGGTVSGRDSFQNADSSISTQINRIKRASPAPDFIFLGSYIPGGASAVKQIRAAGIDLPIVGGAGFDGTFWLKGLPGLKDFYAMVGGVTTPGEDPDPRRKSVFQAYFDKYGKEAPLGSQLLTGYSAVEAFAIAAERAKDVDGAAVKAELDKFADEPLAAGPMTYTPTCHVSGGPWVAITFTGGAEKFVAEVTPKEVGKAVC